MTDWIRQEAGWYTMENVGGIWHFENGWYLYALADPLKLIGPFDTLREAKEAAERKPME